MHQDQVQQEYIRVHVDGPDMLSVMCNMEICESVVHFRASTLTITDREQSIVMLYTGNRNE